MAFIEAVCIKGQFIRYSVPYISSAAQWAGRTLALRSGVPECKAFSNLSLNLPLVQLLGRICK